MSDSCVAVFICVYVLLTLACLFVGVFILTWLAVVGIFLALFFPFYVYFIQV